MEAIVLKTRNISRARNILDHLGLPNKLNEKFYDLLLLYQDTGSAEILSRLREGTSKLEKDFDMVKIKDELDRLEQAEEAAASWRRPRNPLQVTLDDWAEDLKRRGENFIVSNN